MAEDPKKTKFFIGPTFSRMLLVCSLVTWPALIGYKLVENPKPSFCADYSPAENFFGFIFMLTWIGLTMIPLIAVIGSQLGIFDEDDDEG